MWDQLLPAELVYGVVVTDQRIRDLNDSDLIIGLTRANLGDLPQLTTTGWQKTYEALGHTNYDTIQKAFFASDWPTAPQALKALKWDNSLKYSLTQTARSILERIDESARKPLLETLVDQLIAAGIHTMDYLTLLDDKEVTSALKIALGQTATIQSLEREDIEKLAYLLQKAYTAYRKDRDPLHLFLPEPTLNISPPLSAD